MVVRFQRVPPAQSLLDTVFGFGQDTNGFDLIQRDRAWQGETLLPRVDVAEYDNESIVVAEVPGVSKSDVSITIHEGVLTISGSRKASAIPEKSTWVRREVETGTFSRSINLSHDVDANAVTAEMSNGLLKIVLPKAEDAKPKEITIR